MRMSQAKKPTINGTPFLCKFPVLFFGRFKFTRFWGRQVSNSEFLRDFGLESILISESLFGHLFESLLACELDCERLRQQFGLEPYTGASTLIDIGWIWYARPVGDGFGSLCI